MKSLSRGERALIEQREAGGWSGVGKVCAAGGGQTRCPDHAELSSLRGLGFSLECVGKLLQCEVEEWHALIWTLMCPLWSLY